ncbi:hypothetical protein E4K10_12440 [Streptomyces sp. T1317-0309]|nr:hypothetical protein E4K10_12440 [Streptomyces sp. T1317-0309]
MSEADPAGTAHAAARPGGGVGRQRVAHVSAGRSAAGRQYLGGVSTTGGGTDGGGTQFGRLLRELRHSRRLTIEELAESSGISGRAIGDMERGRSLRPHRGTVTALGQGLQLDDAGHAELLAAARAARPGPSPAVPAAVSPYALPRGPGTSSADIGNWHICVPWWRWPPRTGERRSGRRIPSHRRWWWSAVRPAAARPPWRSGWPRSPRACSPTARSCWTCRGWTTSRCPPNRPWCGCWTPGGSTTPTWRPTAPRSASRATGRSHPAARGPGPGQCRQRGADPTPSAREGRLLVVVTSRRTLAGLEGVQRAELGALDDKESVSLLRAVVGAARVDAEPEAARSVTELCGHLPLALRVAANWVATRTNWSLQRLADRLADEDRRLDALSAGDLRVNAAFSLSYSRLDPLAARMFRLLSLVPGRDFGVPLAAVVAGVPCPTPKTSWRSCWRQVFS